MTKVATLTGHTYRVLYLAISPDGQTVVTGAGDETLRCAVFLVGWGQSELELKLNKQHQEQMWKIMKNW